MTGVFFSFPSFLSTSSLNSLHAIYHCHLVPSPFFVGSGSAFSSLNSLQETGTKSDTQEMKIVVVCAEFKNDAYDGRNQILMVN